MKKCIWIMFLSLVAGLAWSQQQPVVGEALEEAGTRLELRNGNQLQLAIEELKVVGYFIDSEGMLLESPADSIVVEVDHPGNRNDEWRTVIKPVDAAKLSSVRSMAAPYKFKTRLIIRYKDGSTETLANSLVELDKGQEES